MNVIDFVKRCFEDNHKSLLIAVDGLSHEELSWQPEPHCNSIGFLVWHYGRAQDVWIGRITQVPQLWEQGWAEKFGRAPAESFDTGANFSVEQVQAFQVPDVSVLLDYAKAALANTLTYLDNVSEDDLENLTFQRPSGEFLTLGTILEQLVWELNQHGGQIAYIRGMRRGIEDGNTSGPALARTID